MTTKKIVLFGTCILIPLLIGGISGFLTLEGVNGWYRFLNKPSFNPPNAVFGPVWTSLYTLMGISLYLIVRAPASAQRTAALRLFAIQLTLNFFWSILFFRWHLLMPALVEVAVMWATILGMIVLFRRVSATAAWLQIPYLLWTTFASILNGALLYLNS